MSDPIRRVLVITAHPDDCEFGAGGTVAKFVKEGKDVGLVVVTNGDKGSSDRAMTSARLAAIREEEQRNASRALGVDPATRGQGVGRALTIACIERARADGAAGIALNTLSFMPAATALYEGLGFHQTGGNGTVEWGGGKLLSYIQNIDQIS